MGVKGGWGFGVLFFSIFFAYFYAFFMGSLWVDLEMWNHAMDRPY